jgi:endonuclease-3
MNAEKRRHIYERLRAANPTPTTELHLQADPFELLVAVMLSAQATDKSVNLATATLFRRGRHAGEAMLALGEAGLVEPTSGASACSRPRRRTCWPPAASSCWTGTAARCPAERAALEALPGVGRKTANVVLNTAFGEPTIAVDTHIFRVANRTGLAPGKTVLEVEKKLLQATRPPEFKPGRPPLADPARPLRLQGAQARLRRSASLRDLCEFREKTPT